MRYLVTGGAGFIGSHLADALLAAQHDVIILDDLSSGHRTNLPAAAEFIQGDCGDPAILASLIGRVDGVFHLAAIASVPRSQAEWLACTRTNLLATVALLEAIAKRHAPIPFVYASSAAVYGNPDIAVITEDTPKSPLSPYGADKYACELHAAAARIIFNIPTLGLRFFNVFGSRQDPSSAYSGVISIFMNRLAQSQPITIFGDGQQTRDFIHVFDVIAHLLAAMQRLEQHGSPEQPALNVCSGTAVNLLNLAQEIASLCNIEAVIHHAESRSGDIRHSLGNPALATLLLGVQSRMSLRDGLAEIRSQNNT